ncbi:MAG: stage II sporulation protein E, partial [Clostridiaceae bacterium]|nr:stage II sporulation protein E [Clostridiaceae bacterium]
MMQYGVELFPYQRIKKMKNEEKKQKFQELSDVFKIISYFVAAFLVGRVLMVNLMAPFGIAYLIAIIVSENNKISLVSGIGTLLGYVSLYNNVKNLPVYFIVTATLLVLNYILKNIEQKKKLLLILFSIFLEL